MMPEEVARRGRTGSETKFAVRPRRTSRGGRLRRHPALVQKWLGHARSPPPPSTPMPSAPRKRTSHTAHVDRRGVVTASCGRFNATLSLGSYCEAIMSETLRFTAAEAAFVLQEPVKSVKKALDEG